MQSDTPIRPSDLQLEQQLCFMLYRNTARFIGCWDRFLRRYQLTFSEYVVLLALWEGWPASESAIAMRLQLDPYTLEDALANLERSRMLTRSTYHGVPGDRLIEPTHKGLDLRPELEEVRRRFSCELGLAPATAQALLLQLQSLSEALAGSEPMWGGVFAERLTRTLCSARRAAGQSVGQGASSGRVRQRPLMMKSCNM